MRKLLKSLMGDIDLQVPAPPQQLFQALVDAMARRRGETIELRMASFPEGTNLTGVVVELKDRHLIVVEADTPPEHQLVILGHELWHLHAGHCIHGLPGSAAAQAYDSTLDPAELATVVAARTQFEENRESEAEVFGYRLGAACRGWLAGTPAARSPIRLNEVGGRINASLGYHGPQG
ncbi:toxin-antitoxin system, toxin component [Streptomyces sp. NPDC097619]|uniref:toxin-antitoxin system, toxin component n=1 Tax=Streptomyces sp. NPDC097619 TaxID=3157228 RepID=UPI0033184670